jgi:hypothetical protein
LRSARNVATCLIVGGGGRGGKRARGARKGDSGNGGGNGKGGGNPWGDDGSSGDLWIETLDTTTTKRHEEEIIFVDDDDDATNGSRNVEQLYMGTNNMDPTTKYFYSNVKVMNQEDSEGKCCEKAFETLIFSLKCK